MEKICSVCENYPLIGVPGSYEPRMWCPDHPEAKIIERPSREELSNVIEKLKQSFGAYPDVQITINQMLPISDFEYTPTQPPEDWSKNPDWEISNGTSNS